MEKVERTSNTNSYILTPIMILLLSWAIIPAIIGILASRTVIKLFYQLPSPKTSYRRFFITTFLAILCYLIEISVFVASIDLLNTLLTNSSYQNNQVKQTLLELLFSGLIIGSIVSFIWPFLHLLTRKFIFKKVNKWQEQRQQALKENQLAPKHFKEPFKLTQKFLFYHFYAQSVKEKEKKQSRDLDAIYLNDHTYILRENLGLHISILGSTGMGKTNTILHFCRDSIVKNKPLIFVDGKGDKELINQLALLCQEHNRIFKVVSLDEELKNPHKVSYDAFANKDDHEVLALIGEIFDYSSMRGKDSSYYQQMEQALFQTIIPILIKLDIKISFQSLAKYLQKEEFQRLVTSPKNIEKLYPNDYAVLKVLKKSNFTKEEQSRFDLILTKVKEKILSRFASHKDQVWDDAYNKINNFAKSTNALQGGGLTLKQAIEENLVVLFSIETLLLPQTSQHFTDVVVQDFKQQSRINHHLNRHTMLILDEFGAINSSNTIRDLLLQGRSMGFEILLSYQGLSELSNISIAFKDSVLNNTNTLICHHINNANDAEEISNCLGTEKIESKTYQTLLTDSNKGDEFSGVVSQKVVDQFSIHPNDLKKLPRGYAAVKTLDAKKNVILFGIQKIDQVVFKSPEPAKLLRQENIQQGAINNEQP